MERELESQAGLMLPEELLVAVFNRLGSRPLAVAACVCRSWKSAAIVVNAVPGFRSALSRLPRLEDAMDAVVEEVLRAPPLWPDFAILFAGAAFQLSQISALVKRKLPKNMPLIACNSAGLAGKDVASGEHSEILFDVDQENHGLVLVVGRFPGVCVKSHQLHDALSVDEVERFVAAASEVSSGEGHLGKTPIAILLMGDPVAHTNTVLDALDKAHGGTTPIVGGLATFVEDMEAGCILAHCVENRPSVSDSGRSRRKSQRVAEKVAVNGLGKGSRCDFVSLVFTEETLGSSSNRVCCTAAAAGGLKAVGPVYKVVSVRETKDKYTKEISTQISCEREGQLMDVLVDIESETEGTGNPPNHIGIFRKQKRHNQLLHFSLHALQEANEEYLSISGGGVKTRDSFRFYQVDPPAARDSVEQRLSLIARNMNDPTSAVSANRQILGGLFFGCAGRGFDFFGEANVESSIFQENLPGTSMGGMFCLAEFGPPAILEDSDVETDDSSHMKTDRFLSSLFPVAIENFFSSMFLVFYVDR